MLHVRTSQLIIAGDGAAFKEMFSPVQKITVLYKYKCSSTFSDVLLTLLNKYKIFKIKPSFPWLTVTVKKTTKHFDQCGSHDDKNTLYFGGLGQITDMQ